jgi:hypothetical protein
MNYLIFLALTTFLLGLPASTVAQSVVESQISLITRTHRLLGFSKTHSTKYVDLDDDETDIFTLELNRGYTYRIVAVCDGDCGDLDLCIYDNNYNKVDCDEQSDDKPMLNVSPRLTGRYKIWVKMYECRLEPCRTAILIYGK